MTKSNRVKAKKKSVIETLENLQAMAANGQLSEVLRTSGAPEFVSPSKAKSKRFSRLVPFERSTFDYEKYCTSLAAGSMAKKPLQE